MKGFPNQIADLRKLAQGMATLAHLVDSGAKAKNYGVFGEALVRARVLGTGHTPKPIEAYICEQRAKPADRQSFQTSARGLRELFRMLGFIDDANLNIVIHPLGRQAAAFADAPLDGVQIDFWGRAIRAIRHQGGDAEASHPYQVLLRLIARRPGITRAMCALALEAKSDSDSELDRIVELAGRPEEEARRAIGVSKANWNNAKKVLPKFAEQLGDVIKTGQTFRLADAPGRGADLAVGEPAPDAGRAAGTRAPRTARTVSAATIARAGTTERFDDAIVPVGISPAAAAAAAASRLERLKRHNLLVQALAGRLGGEGRELFEDPFDLLALIDRLAILAEIKTLDGSIDDQRERVRDALAQLLYYEAFVTRPVARGGVVRKVACFERPISDEHRQWLNDSNIAVLWREGDRFRGDVLAEAFLGTFIDELRRGR